MRSALYIGSKQNNPLTKTKIPSCGSPNGMPFCFEYSGAVTQWQLVKDGDEYGYDLDVSWLTNDGKYIYYNGDVDLLAYLDGLGYDARAGRYYYRFMLDGVDAVVGETMLNFVSTSVSTAPTTQAYGEWIFDIEYKAGVQIQFYLLNPSPGVYYLLDISSDIGLYTFIPGGSVLFTGANTLSNDGRYKLKLQRNSFTDEYITGGIGTFVFYIEDVLFVTSSGSNPVSNNAIPISTKIDVGSDAGNGLYSINSIMPEDFTTVSGTTEIISTRPSGGTIKQSNIFQIECEDLRPVTPGDFNNDFNNDFF